MRATKAQLEAAIKKAQRLGEKIIDLEDSGIWTWDECGLFGALLEALYEVVPEKKRKR